MLNFTQEHYGSKVIAWVKGMLSEQEVLPLALIGPSKSGKSHFVEGLKSWVRVHYLAGVLSHPKGFNDVMEYAKVLVIEGEEIPDMYSYARFVEIRSPFRPTKEVRNRYACIGCYREDSSVIPECAIKIQLNEVPEGRCLPSAKFLVLELLK